MITEAQGAKPRRLRSDRDAARISTARTAASDAGLSELVVNAQEDHKLVSINIGAEDGPLEEVLAGALLDLGTLMTVTGRIALPVNVMADPGAPSGGAHSGEARVCLPISQAAYMLARRAAAEVLSTSTYNILANLPVGSERQERKAS